MKREDFVIDGIPDGYQIYDVDLAPSGQEVVVLGHSTDNTQPVLVRWGGAEITLPDGCLWWHPYHELYLLRSIVRAAGETRLVAVNGYARSDDQINGFVWNTSGELEGEFHAGDDVEEVLASDDFILLFYGDEGQTGGLSLSRQAMAVMSQAGEMLWGHRSQFGKKGFDVWFHAAVWNTPDEVAVFADVDHKCAFVRLNVREREQDLWQPPAPLASPSAVTTIGDRVIGHGSGLSGNEDPESWLNPNDPWVRELTASGLREDHIFEWLPGASIWQTLGAWAWQFTRNSTYFGLRGLPGGRFIAPKRDGYTILSFD